MHFFQFLTHYVATIDDLSRLKIKSWLGAGVGGWLFVIVVEGRLYKYNIIEDTIPNNIFSAWGIFGVESGRQRSNDSVACNNNTVIQCSAITLSLLAVLIN